MRCARGKLAERGHFHRLPLSPLPDVARNSLTGASSDRAELWRSEGLSNGGREEGKEGRWRWSWNVRSEEEEEN